MLMFSDPARVHPNDDEPAARASRQGQMSCSLKINIEKNMKDHIILFHLLVQWEARWPNG